ncbi:MAG: hypothetical protein D6687_10040 [Acidobacteria bacterium]|jgi:phosphopentomutase|nr:MAG: hypothetical protein D6687_10040 [Acidobacteriota bacterium]GIU81198.1 MAG: metalloenzyme [Pyrinomonadaceae bacterium]
MKHSVLLFFIDGLGIGERNEHNPLAIASGVEPLAYFKNENHRKIFADGVMIPTDARLGVEGRPQSASGQTTILTGVNAPAKIGYHKQGFPNEDLREILQNNSIFLKLLHRRIERITFANAYTPQFFQSTPRWKSATTLAVEAAKLPFRKLSDLLGRQALYHDFTNRALQEKGFQVPAFSVQEAAQILADLTESHQFVLYEHFITDKIGHAQDFQKAQEHLPKLAELVRELLQKVNLERTTVILTSDHGNIEDLSIRNHTLNDVPTIVWGRKKNEVASKIKDLTDITPTILELLTDE